MSDKTDTDHSPTMGETTMDVTTADAEVHSGKLLIKYSCPKCGARDAREIDYRIVQMEAVECIDTDCDHLFSVGVPTAYRDYHRFESELSTANAKLAIALEALAPFAEFSRQWRRQPMKGIGDEFYGIHTGTEYEASLKISDCHRAATAISEIEKVK